jgi:hypothetical protein
VKLACIRSGGREMEEFGVFPLVAKLVVVHVSG